MADHQQFSFAPGQTFKWSPQTNTIYYDTAEDDRLWSLLHELAHALLGHESIKSDVELIKAERSAWDKALLLASDYGVTIDTNYIEDCLDTYRDWLKKRATCPACATVSLQGEDGAYVCHNCYEEWRVPASPNCRVLRIKKTS